MFPRKIALRHIAIATALVVCAPLDILAQEITFKRKEAETIAAQVAEDVRKRYYDPKLHGVDWDDKLRELQKKIGIANSSNLAFANIAAMLESLDDSHTFFIP